MIITDPHQDISAPPPTEHSDSPRDSTSDSDSKLLIRPPMVSLKSERMRTIALVVIGFLLVSHALYVAASMMIPVVAAIVIALALRPIVRKLRKYKIPSAVGAFLTLAIAFGLFVGVASQLVTPISDWVSKTPIEFRLRELARKLEPLRGTMDVVRSASDNLSEAVSGSPTTVSSEQAPDEVVVKPPSLISEMISSTWQVSAGILLTLVLTFFFLAKGSDLLDQIARVFPVKTLHSDDEHGLVAVERSVSHYLLTVSGINACLGCCVGLACWFIGIPNPLLWGVMAALLNFLPYIGGLVGAGVVLLVSLFTFDSLPYALLAPAVYLTLTAIEGNFVTPAILGRSMSLNPLIVILSLTYWTWLWGAPGAILAVPLLAIFVASCRQFEATVPLARMLSD